jgi:hypothetical protein
MNRARPGALVPKGVFPARAGPGFPPLPERSSEKKSPHLTDFERSPTQTTIVRELPAAAEVNCRMRVSGVGAA